MSIFGDIAKGVVGGIATPFSQAWIATKQSTAAMHEIDRKTDRDITIEAYRTDVQLAMTQQLLADADRTHWSTRWIRPAFAGLSLAYCTMALFGWLPKTPIPQPVEWLLGIAIPSAILLLRPFEKNKRLSLASAGVTQAPPARSLPLPRKDREGAAH